MKLDPWQVMINKQSEIGMPCFFKVQILSIISFKVFAIRFLVVEAVKFPGMIIPHEEVKKGNLGPWLSDQSLPQSNMPPPPPITTNSELTDLPELIFSPIIYTASTPTSMRSVANHTSAEFIESSDETESDLSGDDTASDEDTIDLTQASDPEDVTFISSSEDTEAPVVTPKVNLLFFNII